MLTNSQLSESNMFKTQCLVLNVNPTKRQASKWRRKCGSLYKALLSAAAEESFEAEVIIATVKILDAQKKTEDPHAELGKLIKANLEFYQPVKKVEVKSV